MAFNRRQFLTLGGVGLAGALSFQAWRSLSNAPVSPQVSGATVVRSDRGLLEVALNAQYGSFSLDGDPAQTFMTYNGQLPGPRLEVNPGDRLIIHFTNTLDQSTNLHFHGLHLAPTGNQDNIFREVKPGASVTYELPIHPQQRPGTYWYHPHWHGVVAEQLFRGLAGLIVVRGELDQIPAIAAAQEEFLVLQDFPRGANVPRSGGPGMGMAMDQNFMAGRQGELITLNGLPQPTIDITQDWLRLRLLNASPSRFYRLQIPDISWQQIATDGGALAQPKVLGELLLTPGQRAEVLIPTDQWPDRQSLPLENLPYARAQMGMMGGQFSEPPTAIAHFRKRLGTENPASPSITLPDRLSTLEKLENPVVTRRFTLNHGMAPGRGMAFLINGESYAGTPQTTVTLGDVEDWELINTGTMDHPFHVHVNGFQVVSRNGEPETDLAWRDTVLVRVGETVRIRIRFDDFPGTTVYHCHILDHEDLGMMGQLWIQPPST